MQPRQTLLLALLVSVTAALVGCGGENGLTVRGSVGVTGADLLTGFNFAQDTRIDEVEASSRERITGLCEMRQMVSEAEDDQYGIIVEIYRGGAVQGNELSTVTIMQRTDSLPEEGHVALELGTTGYASRPSQCQISIEYAVRDSGMVGLTGSCDVYDADNNVVNTVIGLDIVGCTVAE